MDIEKAKRLLAKINVLVENADDSFSTLENDLLKTYIKDLYECVSGMEPVTAKQEAQQSNPQRLEVEVVAEKHEAPAREKPNDIPAHSDVLSDTTSTFSTSEVEPKEASEKPADNSGNTEFPPKQDKMKQGETVPVLDASANASASPELEALFALPRGEDLASKLSAKPIRLVEEGMGINDRISAINELFGRDHELFQETLKKVNEFESYDQAREFLIGGVALSQQWSAEEKAEKAIEFIRLIGRKFRSN